MGFEQKSAGVTNRDFNSPLRKLVYSIPMLLLTFTIIFAETVFLCFFMAFAVLFKDEFETEFCVMGFGGANLLSFERENIEVSANLVQKVQVDICSCDDLIPLPVFLPDFDVDITN